MGFTSTAFRQLVINRSHDAKFGQLSSLRIVGIGVVVIGEVGFSSSAFDGLIAGPILIVGVLLILWQLIQSKKWKR